MHNLPKIVRDRMTTAPPVTHHPDADVLTAFAEKSLPALERDSVLEHLGRCRECRDVVALSLPEIATQTVIVPARTSWFSWPVMRWGFAAAGIVVVASLGILLYQGREHMSLASKTVRLEVATTAGQTQPITANPTHTEKQEEAKDKALSVAQSQGLAEPEAKLIAPKEPAPQAPSRINSYHGAVAGIGGPAIAGGAARFGPSAPANWQNNAQLQNNAQWQQKKLAVPQVQMPALVPAPAPANDQAASLASNLKTPSPNATEASGQAPAVSTYPQDLALQAKAAAPVPPLDYSRAKEPVLGAENAAPQPSETGAEAQELPIAREGGVSGRNFTQLAPVVPMPRWTISSTGSLQRSFDQGKTWQDVDVIATLVPSASGASFAFSAKTAVAKQKLAEANVPGLPTAPLIFRAVTAIGPEVWAGGSNAALFHSMDAGNHWTRVLPQSAGAVPAGDIVSVQFTDAQHGRILTSTGETWITPDAGQTWQKQ